MMLLILYVIVAVVYHAVRFYISWRKFKKKAEVNQSWKAIKDVILTFANGRLLKKKLLNFYTIPLIVILAVITCCYILPFCIFDLLKKSVGYKTKTEKEAEEENRLMEEAHIKSQEFLKNEGRGDINDIHVDFNEIIKDNTPLPNTITVSKFDDESMTAGCDNEECPNCKQRTLTHGTGAFSDGKFILESWYTCGNCGKTF